MKILNKKIEVICRHSEDGAILPLRFRVEDKEQDCSHAYNLRVNYKDVEKISRDNYIDKYNCCYSDCGISVKAEIHYKRNECIWTLYKVF